VTGSTIPLKGDSFGGLAHSRRQPDQRPDVLGAMPERRPSAAELLAQHEHIAEAVRREWEREREARIEAAHVVWEAQRRRDNSRRLVEPRLHRA
jgi:hypothetical protein